MRGELGRKFRGTLQSVSVIQSLAYLSCFASIACSEDVLLEPHVESTSALIGGSLSPSERDAVIFIRANHPDGGFADCTGTLLSPHVVITAKHCVALLQPGEFVCTGAGTLVENGQGAGVFGAKVDGAKIEVFTGTAPVSAPVAHARANFMSESSDACHDDIAALVLDTPIQQDAYPMLRRERPVQVGEAVRLVGYGTLDHAKLIERREIPDVRVIDVGLDDGTQNPNAITPARSFVVAGATACFGDSGGPALAMDTGALTGVYSRITGDCLAVESRNEFIRVASFSSLLDRAFTEAGEQPQLEPPVVTTGGPSDASASGAATGGSAGLVAATGGSQSVVASSQTKPHAALRCSIKRINQRTGCLAGAWLLLAMVAAFSRRCCGGRPSSGD